MVIHTHTHTKDNQTLIMMNNWYRMMIHIKTNRSAMIIITINWLEMFEIFVDTMVHIIIIQTQWWLDDECFQIYKMHACIIITSASCICPYTTIMMMIDDGQPVSCIHSVIKRRPKKRKCLPKTFSKYVDFGLQNITWIISQAEKNLAKHKSYKWWFNEAIIVWFTKPIYNICFARSWVNEW